MIKKLARWILRNEIKNLKYKFVELEIELKAESTEKMRLYWSNMALRKDLVECDRLITKLSGE